MRVMPDVTEDVASSNASELAGDRPRYMQQCPEHGQAYLHAHSNEARQHCTEKHGTPPAVGLAAEVIKQSNGFLLMH